MGKVTAIRGHDAGKQVRVFLDGRFAFTLEAETAAKQGLRLGQELGEGEIESLIRANDYARCLDAAARYLSYRPRSEAELRKRLFQRGFDGTNIESALRLLKERDLVDDAAFAQFWRDNRESFRPRSRWLTRVELKQKGVPEDIIDEVVAEVDDNDGAYRAAMGKVRSLSLADYQSFRRRMNEYLRRRGFGYGVINQTISRVWQESQKEQKD